MCGSSRLVACETLQRERFEGWIMRVNTCSSLQKRKVSHTYYPFTNRLMAQMYFYDEMPCGIRESRGVQQDRDIGFCSGRVV